MGVSKPSLHDRIVHLERLCTSLMEDSAHSSKTDSGSCDRSITGDSGRSGSATLVSTGGTTARADEVSSPSVPASECGSLHISCSEQRYVGGDHWAAILDGIADLKDHSDYEEQLRLVGAGTDPHLSIDQFPNPDAVARPSYRALLLYGSNQPVSREDIFDALPPKPIVDRYISRYFNRVDLVSPSIHGPSFLREYEAFWADPLSASVLWIGLLFGLICLALLASEASETEQQQLQIGLYREKAAQCLVLGQYTKGGQHALEALIHYVYIEFVLRPDAFGDLWFLLALEVNLAMRMGYHRDPSHFPGMSSLQAEIRRRVWATVVLGDILLSSQMGMPRMIADWKYDTAEPRNLNDADLTQDGTAMPPARPETEHTTVLGVIARSRVLRALSTILDLISSVRVSSYAEVLRADEMLRAAAASIPPPLRMRPMAACLTDPPPIIMSRLFINHMVHKGHIMLHRRFLFLKATPTAAATTEDVFASSRRACIDAALGNLHIQHILDEETCGGQLHTMRWRVTSVMNHEFLTDTLILCSLLLRRRQNSRGQAWSLPLDREDEIIAALRKSRAIWISRSNGSNEAKTAAEAVSLVLLRKASEAAEMAQTAQTAETGIGSATSGIGSNYNMNIDSGDGDNMMAAGGWQGYLADLPLASGIMGEPDQGLDWQKLLQETIWNFEPVSGYFALPNNRDGPSS